MGFFIWYFVALAIANKFQTDMVSVQEMPANLHVFLRHFLVAFRLGKKNLHGMLGRE
jgi:hypothetical protein